jgi:DNA/RNA-binding domain of Phe-tRNA-synthetase-like protein
MIEVSIAELIGAFPDAVIAFVVTAGIEAGAEASTVVEQRMAEARQAAVARIAGRDFADVPELACWRRAYKVFGVRGTSHRSSVERMARLAVRADRTLPRVSPLVDAYNAISLGQLVPVGADDLDQVQPPLAFRIARPGDRFVPLGSATGAEEPPEPGEVVYADAARILCRRWNWYQGAHTAITEPTRRAVLTVQALGPGARAVVEQATHELDEILTRVLGSRQRVVVLDRATPTAHLADPTPTRPSCP